MKSQIILLCLILFLVTKETHFREKESEKISRKRKVKKIDTGLEGQRGTIHPMIKEV